VSYKYLDAEDMSISKQEYNNFLKEYKMVRNANSSQFLLDGFLIGISGEVPDTDYEELNEKPIEWWLKELSVFPKEIAYMAKSVWDNINIFPIEFIRIK